ncbi:MAG: penicillin-binding protein 2, partial [Treponema sp.]|nr:penicillin-binding protein 2 [Treponema sp.]
MALLFSPGKIMNEERSMGRIRLLQWLLVIPFLLYGFRLFTMQVVSGEEYSRMSVNIAKRTKVIPARRGEIYDRTFSEPLAVNDDTFAVMITPAEVPENEMEGLITSTARILGIPRQEIEDKIPQQYYRLYQSLEIASNVSFETIAVLAENFDTLPGLDWQPKPV